MWVYYELGTLLGPKNSLPTLAALVGKIIIYARLRLTKIIFF